MVWRRQFQTTLDWLLYFLRACPGALKRIWRYEAFAADLTHIAFLLDASPWGLGGVLIIGGIPVAWFASPLTTHDEKIHGQAIGSDKGQQVWESLCVLVALKVYASQWMDKRVALTITGDNVAALTLAAYLKGKGPRTLIAQEISLIYSFSSFEPAVLKHIPGVTNVQADGLSRLYQPDAHYEIPPQLREVPRTPIPIRDRSYYRCLAEH